MTLLPWVLFFLGFLNARKLNLNIHSANWSGKKNTVVSRNKATCSVFVLWLAPSVVPTVQEHLWPLFPCYLSLSCSLFLLSFRCPLTPFDALFSDLYHCSLLLLFVPCPIMLFSALFPWSCSLTQFFPSSFSTLSLFFASSFSTLIPWSYYLPHTGLGTGLGRRGMMILATVTTFFHKESVGCSPRNTVLNGTPPALHPSSAKIEQDWPTLCN